ncbi:MAG: ATP-binding protein [Chloroflexota bacterium]
MTATLQSTGQIQRPAAPAQKLWDALTKPVGELRDSDKPKARLLSAMLVVYIPLSLFTVFASPVAALIEGKPVTTLAPALLIGELLTIVAYVFSRSRYYSVGAWMIVSVPIIAVGLPILTTGVLTSIISLFFLSLSVIMAGLLLTSRDTLIVGVIVAAIPILSPQPQTLVTTTGSPNITVFSFVLLTTGITVLVGRIREGYLHQLETSQSELTRSLTEKEEARVQAELSREQAERSDQVKSAFLASMSHELRTPLNSIINFTRFVADGDTGPVNDEQKELLLEVVGSGKHLLNLINDVLDMSKIEAGSLNLFIEDNVNLKTILDTTVATGRSLLKEAVQIETAVDENLPLIRGDRQRILQILLNLISNACKFTEEGEIKISAHQANGEIVISVKDTGLGIAPEDQALVFEAFKQTTTGLRQGGGTGLGMPIAKSLAEAHGGRLWLESEVSKGSTFFISLPIKSDTLIPTLA